LLQFGSYFVNYLSEDFLLVFSVVLQQWQYFETFPLLLCEGLHVAQLKCEDF